MMISCNGKKKEKVLESEIKTGTAQSSYTGEIREVTFLPYWVANAQFVGYYMAVEKGIYEKYGLKVTIIPFQPFITSTDLIKEGKADFAALWLVNAIELKASGTDIVNIAQPSFRSSLMLVAKKKSGINTLQDMNGKKAGIWDGFELQPKALFKKYHLDVKIIPIGSTNSLFLRDGVDITNANWFDEYHSIINSGFNANELNTFFFADYGLNFLEDGIYCLSEKMKKDPKVCADFINATFEGWLYAFNNREEAVDIVVRNAIKDKLPVNRAHQRWMLDRYKDLYFPEGMKAINTNLSRKDYEFVGNVLKESGLIKQIPPYEKYFQPVLNVP
jgi:NitT/TauT family transport system substrate-binding protein